MRKLWLAAVLVSMACASAPIKKADLAALAEADAKVLLGCYDCLLEAHATYQRIAVAKARPLVLPKVFETDLLIALREREMAVAASGAYDEAQKLAKELGPAIDAERYLKLVEGVPVNELGTPARETDVFRRAHLVFGSTIDDEIAWLGTAALQKHVNDYVALAIDCGYPRRPRRAGQPPRPTGQREPAPDASPLIAFRTATCRDLVQPVLYRLHEDQPKFAETGYFLARFDIAVAQQQGPGHARERLAEAFARFPKSPAVNYLYGNFHQLIGDCREALRSYAETIAAKPEHENAWLGRTQCMSFLKQHDEAIGAATHMLDAQMNIAEAYYWRAWNRHALKQLEPARADIEKAESLNASAPVLTLGGIIKYDQDDLDPSHLDFYAARHLAYGDQNCVSMWYLGLIDMRRKNWLPSAAQFEEAMGCYGEKVKDSEAGLASMRAKEEVDADFKARQIANFEAAVKEDTRQQCASAFNAANYYATGGNIAKAKVLVDFAAKDESLAEMVGKLRDWLKDK